MMIRVSLLAGLILLVACESASTAMPQSIADAVTPAPGIGLSPQFTSDEVLIRAIEVARLAVTVQSELLTFQYDPIRGIDRETALRSRPPINESQWTAPDRSRRVSSPGLENQLETITIGTRSFSRSGTQSDGWVENRANENGNPNPAQGLLESTVVEEPPEVVLLGSKTAYRIKALPVDAAAVIGGAIGPTFVDDTIFIDFEDFSLIRFERVIAVCNSQENCDPTTTSQAEDPLSWAQLTFLEQEMDFGYRDTPLVIELPQEFVPFDEQP